MISLSNPTSLLLRALPIFFVLYVCHRLVQRLIFTYRVRRNPHYATLPHLPVHWAWGNLINCGERLSPSHNQHPDYAFEEIWTELKRPQAFFVDLAPIDRGFLVVADPSVAEAIVQPSTVFKYSVPKSDTLATMYRLIGLESLITAEGEEWRALRRRFNKGFSPAHLHSLGPLIITKTRVFVDRLRAAAQSHEVFALKEFAQDLTTDIITELTIETDFQAQSTPEGQGHKSPLGILTASRILSSLVFKVGQGFDPLGFVDPVRPTKSWFYEQIFNRGLYKVVKQQLDAENAQLQEERESDAKEKNSTSTKAITRLALSGLQPTPALIRNTVAQIKSFLFAGQDTTATLLQWLAYELSKASYSPAHAAFLAKLTSEHDAVFGAASPFSALDVLSTPGVGESILGDKLPYTTAFVKETLRLHPPAATARLVPEISAQNPEPFVVDVDGVPTQINGLRVYPCQWLLHRNEAVWGADAHAFRPDRWLDEAYMANLPVGAWRPFERGPRNCIGQELAMMEGKIVLCAVARAFTFEKVGLTGRAGEEGEREVWNINTVTSVPVDGMRMRVEMR